MQPNLKKCSQSELHQYVLENKVLIDNKGTPCWVYNPKLFNKYAKKPELLI